MSRQDNHFIDPGDNTTLVITDAQPRDAGGYTCRLMVRDEISITHRLIVNTLSFEITPVRFLLYDINRTKRAQVRKLVIVCFKSLSIFLIMVT